MKRNLLLSILSGLVLAAAMPRPGVWAAAWVGLVPLLLACRGARPGQAALCGMITGMIYYGVVLYWVSLFGYLPWAVLLIEQGVYFAVFAVLAATLSPSRTGPSGWVAVPAAWTLLQWARSLGTYGFTWAGFAHTQADNLAFAQMASVTGPWGIEFIVCLANLTFARMIADRGGRRVYAPGLIVPVIVGAIWIAGSITMNAEGDHQPNTCVAVIQGNVAQDVIPDVAYLGNAFAVYKDLTIRAAEGSPDIVVWPETTIPAPITETGWGVALGGLARRVGADLIVGGYDIPSQAPDSGFHNGAHFFSRAGARTGVYHKVRLVPYGEFVPLRDHLPFLRRYGIRDRDVVPGKSHNLVETNMGRVGVSICFESLFPSISREEVRAGAVALFVITNDSWFGRTQAARQHLMMAKLRAIENRRYVVRAAATGISAIIDPFGRAEDQLDLFTRGYASDDIAPLRAMTTYARFGDYIVYASALAVAAGLAAYTPKRRR